MINNIFNNSIIISIFIVLLLSGCKNKSELVLEPEKITFAELPGWNKDDIENIVPAFIESCKVISKSTLTYPHLPYYNQKDLKKVCKRFLKSSSFNTKNFRKFIHDWFEPYRCTLQEQSLFTGYYAPIVKGSFVKGGRYKFPVYTKPDDLVIIPDLSVFISEESFIKRRISGKVVKGRLVPYFTRAEIDNGALKNKNLEIIWLDNIVDLFFLQIQGSGFVELPDGTRLAISYNGTNGHRYTSIGKHLVNKGVFSNDEVTMQSIKKWLSNNPQQKRKILHQNKSYVFFKISDNNSVYGAQKTKLYPKRSVAIDPKYIPLGVPMWVDTKNPIKNEKMRFLAMTQDTGGAIKSPARVDVFCGYGFKAGELAGKFKERGTYYLLLPKNS
jgi:membrane-bound lytic murein transglycosylase A